VSTRAVPAGERWDYAYDSLGQVTGAVRRTQGGAEIPGGRYGYSFDGIGNRKRAEAYGYGYGWNYTANRLNQYTQ
jgi:YD repeat-containing protein